MDSGQSQPDGREAIINEFVSAYLFGFLAGLGIGYATDSFEGYAAGSVVGGLVGSAVYYREAERPLPAAVIGAAVVGGLIGYSWAQDGHVDRFLLLPAFPASAIVLARHLF